MKSIFRILIGLALLYPAWEMHVTAHKMTNKAIGIEEPVVNTQPPIQDTKKRPARPGDADFFGEDPREVIKRPENKKALEEAIVRDQIAVLMALVSVVLILWGLSPVLVPEWLKQRIEQQAKAASATECKDVDSGEPKAPPRCGDGAEQGDSGHLPDAAEAGGIPGCDGGDLHGGEGGAGGV